jgi:hypothetical protein
VQGRLVLESRGPLAVKKEFIPEEDGFALAWAVTAEGQEAVDLVFVSEWNFYQFEGESSAEEGRILLCGGRVSFSFDQADDLWSFPLQTVSQSEKGYDIIRQGLCIAPVWKARLAPGRTFKARVALRFLRST